MNGDAIADQLTTRDLERLYPEIPWRRPVIVHRTDGAKCYACRVCIALDGLHATEIEQLPQTPEAHEEHFLREHPE